MSFSSICARLNFYHESNSNGQVWKSLFFQNWNPSFCLQFLCPPALTRKLALLVLSIVAHWWMMHNCTPVLSIQSRLHPKKKLLSYFNSIVPTRQSRRKSWWRLKNFPICLFFPPSLALYYYIRKMHIRKISDLSLFLVLAWRSLLTLTRGTSCRNHL